jgi:glutamate dehydrogenase (NADP+)
MPFITKILEVVKERNPNEPSFLQCVTDVMETLRPVMERNKRYRDALLLERIVEPERMIIFRVPWQDDRGQARVNRGYRVEFNSAIGPYNGGLRFHPTVSLDLLKFLGFEQTFTNSLTTLPMGGAKGGSDFDPKGKSDNEVMRFCQSFMTELYRHIGSTTDVPTGDIGVGTREIGYLFGQYKRIRNEFSPVLTGKSLSYGGSLMRMEATGYGCVYFADEMLRTRDDGLKGKVCTVSGSGNVAQFVVEKLIAREAKVVSLSDSSGTIYDRDGIDKEKLRWVMELKNIHRGRIKEYAEKFGVEYYDGRRPWNVPCDCAFPCATENEISAKDAESLINNGCILVAEGATMPSVPAAAERFIERKILYAPGKAANAGGVAVSSLELTQNVMRLTWSREEVEDRLQKIMVNIHRNCHETAKGYGHPGNLMVGANIAAFVKVADAMLAQGLV